MQRSMRMPGEVVVIYQEDLPALYARIEDYTPDQRPRWYQLRLLLLTFPPQEVTWILREPQIDGEPFTMGGVPLQIKSVPSTGTPEQEPEPAKPSPERVRKTTKSPAGKLISLDGKREQKGNKT